MKEPKSTSNITLKFFNEIEFKLFIADGKSKNKSHIYYWYIDAASGEKKRIRDGKGLTVQGLTLKQLKAAAIELAESHIELLEAGWNPITNAVEANTTDLTPSSTIAECMASWIDNRTLAHNNDAIGFKTLKNYKILINTHFKEWLEGNKFQYRKPSSFTKIDIENFLQARAKLKGWGKVSYNCYRTDLGTFFNYLIELKVIKENPVLTTEKKNTKKDRSRFKIYEADELKTVVTLLANDESFLNLYIASKILYKYNIRPVELTRIKVSNIEFEKGLLVLPADATKNKDEAVFSLDEEMKHLLNTLAGDAPADYYLFGARNKPRKVQVDEEYFTQRWSYFRKKYNYTTDEDGNKVEIQPPIVPNHLKFYALKHSSNYYDLKQGASFESIRQKNRHQNLQITTLYIKERLMKDVIVPTENDMF